MAISGIAHWVNHGLKVCVTDQGELSRKTVKILNYTDTLLGIVLVVLGALVVLKGLPQGVGAGWGYAALGAGVVNLLNTLLISCFNAKNDLSGSKCCSESSKIREMDQLNTLNDYPVDNIENNVDQSD